MKKLGSYFRSGNLLLGATAAFGAQLSLINEFQAPVAQVLL